MNRFSSQIKQARSRQWRIFTFTTVGIAAAVTMLMAFWILTRGIAIEIAPEKARDRAALSVKQGPGFIVGKNVYAFSEIVAEASSPGFLTREVVVAAQKQSSFIEIVMQEAPAMLHITTIPEDENTRWFVDTALVARAQSLSMQTEAGNYTLTIDSPHYQKTMLEIAIERGEEVRRSVHLSPIQSQLQINTTPQGASISLDGELQGNTPGVYTVAGGYHAVAISHPGYKDINDTIQVTNADTSISRNYNLLPQDAFVRFQLYPTGGQLLLDGQQVNGADKVRVDSMRQHTVSYFKKGYLSQSRTFTLQPGAEDEVKFSLQKEIGTVEIMSTPKATVLVNGEQAGTTPMTVNLTAVEHDITLVKKGYRSVTQKLTPAVDSVKKINVTLVKELHARLAESPAIYKTSVGITMRLFTAPGIVEMGAARHEKGQRANEFQRKVRLTKTFYAALHETTVAQFSHYKDVAPADNPNVPAVNVNWLDATGFCNWLSAKEGLQPFYILKNGHYHGADIHADGYRLLTEAEWEWLARKAGRKSQTRFVWGDDPAVPAAAGNLADQSTEGTLSLYIPDYTDGFKMLAPTGSFTADKAGLYDLSGNVSEWVHDIYSPAPPANTGGMEVNPVGPVTGDSHVLKGSNWRSASLTELRASFRETAVQGRDDLGFRVARYLYGGENASNQ